MCKKKEESDKYVRILKIIMRKCAHIFCNCPRL